MVDIKLGNNIYEGVTSVKLNSPDGKIIMFYEKTNAVDEKDIRFVDYDGTLLYSYSVDEFATMTEMPPLPEQPGLICQGWNRSMEDAQNYVNKYDKCIIGATYITYDGKTRLYIHLEEGYTSPMVGACPNGTVTVDWGDGTEPDVLTGTSTGEVKWTPNHEYAAVGDYVITLTVDGLMGLLGSAYASEGPYIIRYSSQGDVRNVTYRNALRKVEIGSGIVSINPVAFSYCSNLTYITVPETVTKISEYAFRYCSNLKSVTIPKAVTSIGANAFESCSSLTSITIPETVTSIGTYAFRYCSNLTSIRIPESVTSIGTYAFQYCVNLASITIPETVTSIGTYAFQYCSNLMSITIPESVTSIGTYAFQYCVNLISISIPEAVTTISNYAFQNCSNLTSITIPETVTSIGTYAFRYCYNLTSITIPKAVTTIGNAAFQSCTGIVCYDFSQHTAVPTLANTSAFSGIKSDCEIRVPAALVDEWKAAANWSTYANYIVGV